MVCTVATLLYVAHGMQKEKRQLKEERRVEAIIDEIEAKKSNKKVVSVSMSHLDDIEKNL